MFGSWETTYGYYFNVISGTVHAILLEEWDFRSSFMEKLYPIVGIHEISMLLLVSRLWKRILLWWNTLCLSVIDPFMCLLSDDVFNILMVCISPFWCFVAKCIPLSFAEKAMLPTVILLPPSNNECTVTYAMQHNMLILPLSYHDTQYIILYTYILHACAYWYISAILKWIITITSMTLSIQHCTFIEVSVNI